ncbi:MAG: glycosyltransferase family 2 protein, partial [Planctomycetota bacterium JB042]
AATLEDDPDDLAERIAAAAASAPAKAPPPARAPADAPKVEIVFVSYNSRGIIDEALRSALAQDHPNLVVTVVDNASADGTAEHVRTSYPEVNLIASTENLGFAGGNNLAMERTDADYVALLNQDAVARRDWITEMLRPAEADPEVAVVGAKMLMRRCPTIFNSTGIAMNRTGFCFDRDIGDRDLDPSPTPEEVLGVCGGAMLIRSSVVREIGGLEESFFMYFEDMDFAWRVWLSGWRIVYAPLAVVIHDWHGDLDDGNEADSEVENREKTERRRVLCERNRLQCMFRNYELGTLRKVLPKAWRFDRQRLSWVKAAQARGENPEYFEMVGRAIRDAWRWNLARLGTHLRNRRAIQGRRKVSDAELFRLFGDWEGEPSFLGDLYAICDRHSAAGRPDVRMGKSDARCLGAGWHGVEPLPERDHGCRWTKETAWVYLRPEADATTLVVEGAAGPVDVTLRAAVGLLGGGEGTVPRGETATLRFPLERPASAGVVQEIRLDANTFRPCDHGMGPDTRDLGLRIEAIRFESDR